MAHVIAMAGKGGVGKITLCGLLIQYLCETGRNPVLAVDADAKTGYSPLYAVNHFVGFLSPTVSRASNSQKGRS